VTIESRNFDVVSEVAYCASKAYLVVMMWDSVGDVEEGCNVIERTEVWMYSQKLNLNDCEILQDHGYHYRLHHLLTHDFRPAVVVPLVSCCHHPRETDD